MGRFKSETMEKFYRYVLKKFSVLREYRHARELYLLLADLDFPDSWCGLYEVYEHELNINNSGRITISWNVDKILRNVHKEEEKVQLTVADIVYLADINFKDAIYQSVLEDNSSGRGSKYKSDCIILAELPAFPGYHIIDGNHRFFEKIREPEYVFDCYLISGRNVLKYLEPNSKAFFEAVMYIADAMNITAYDDAV